MCSLALATPPLFLFLLSLFPIFSLIFTRLSLPSFIFLLQYALAFIHSESLSFINKTMKLLYISTCFILPPKRISLCYTFPVKRKRFHTGSHVHTETHARTCGKVCHLITFILQGIMMTVLKKNSDNNCYSENKNVKIEDEL